MIILCSEASASGLMSRALPIQLSYDRNVAIRYAIPARDGIDVEKVLDQQRQFVQPNRRSTLDFSLVHLQAERRSL